MKTLRGLGGGGTLWRIFVPVGRERTLTWLLCGPDQANRVQFGDAQMGRFLMLPAEDFLDALWGLSKQA